MKSLLFILMFSLSSMMLKAQCTTTYDSLEYWDCPEDGYIFYNADTLHFPNTDYFVLNGDTAYYGDILNDTLTNFSGCDSIVKLKIYVQPYEYESYNVAGCVDSVFYQVWLNDVQECWSKIIQLNQYSISPKPFLYVNHNYLFWGDTAVYSAIVHGCFNIYTNLINCDSNQYSFDLRWIGGGDSMSLDSFVNIIGYFPSGNYRFEINRYEDNSGGPSYVNVIYDVNCIKSTDCLYLNLPLYPAGVGKINNPLNKLSIYPNPSSDYTTINLQSQSKLKTIQIFSVIGSLVLSQNVNNNVVQLNVTTLASGLYFIKAVDNTGKIYQSKLIKQ